jgi:hypothetical protein
MEACCGLCQIPNTLAAIVDIGLIPILAVCGVTQVLVASYID